ncbi:MAG: gamma carbonic anhydrase family protein [Candidatus Verstraetearchaeota archaeon]|nr:gamma carbonic anhydrase family protein [Candidatus Verstraetearchaeota archaeon]
MTIRMFKGKKPIIDPSAFIDETALIIGDVTIHREVSLWPFTVIRGDIEPIEIGAETNVQDHTVVHTDPGYPTRIGERVTIGHRCVIHGCTVEDEVIIGMGAVLLTGSRVRRRCIIGAGAVVREGQEIPEGSIAVGVPAKIVRTVTEKDVERILNNAKSYLELARRHFGKR